MMKSIRTLLKQLKERYRVPRRVQDVIPINRIWTDGIFMVGHHQFAKTWRFTDINYLVGLRKQYPDAAAGRQPGLLPRGIQ